MNLYWVFFQDIKALLESWKSDLASCDKIFIRAPGGNKRLFLHGKSPPFNKDDERVRMVPFPTRRPTLNEVRRVFEMLSSIECYGNGTTFPSPFECILCISCSLSFHYLKFISNDWTKCICLILSWFIAEHDLLINIEGHLQCIYVTKKTM